MDIGEGDTSGEKKHKKKVRQWGKSRCFLSGCIHASLLFSYRKRNENIVMNMKMMAIHTASTKRKRNVKNNHPVISKSKHIQCKCIILLIIINKVFAIWIFLYTFIIIIIHKVVGMFIHICIVTKVCY